MMSGDLGLHPKCKFVAFHPRRQLTVLGVSLAKVRLIQFAPTHPTLAVDDPGSDELCRIQIKDRRTL